MNAYTAEQCQENSGMRIHGDQREAERQCREWLDGGVARWRPRTIRDIHALNRKASGEARKVQTLLAGMRTKA